VHCTALRDVRQDSQRRGISHRKSLLFQQRAFAILEAAVKSAIEFSLQVRGNSSWFPVRVAKFTAAALGGALSFATSEVALLDPCRILREGLWRLGLGWPRWAALTFFDADAHPKATVTNVRPQARHTRSARSSSCSSD